LSILRTALDLLHNEGKRKASLTDLRAALAALSVEPVEAEVARLEAELQEKLLELDDREVATREKRIEAACLEVRRTARVIEALQHQIEEAERVEIEAKRRAEYDEAKRASAAAAERLQHEYPQLALGIVDVIRALAEAGALVEKVNRALPEDREPLVRPENVVRDTVALPREIISERMVERWVYTGTGNLVADETSVTDHGGGRGVIWSVPGSNGRPCIRRKLREPPTQRRWRDPLSAAVKLPGLTAHEPAFWNSTASHPSEVLGVFARIEAARAEHPQGKPREQKVEYEPLSDADAEALAA
jgi:hypothetical protein